MRVGPGRAAPCTRRKARGPCCGPLRRGCWRLDRCRKVRPGPSPPSHLSVSRQFRWNLHVNRWPPRSRSFRRGPSYPPCSLFRRNRSCRLVRRRRPSRWRRRWPSFPQSRSCLRSRASRPTPSIRRCRSSRHCPSGRRFRWCLPSERSLPTPRSGRRSPPPSLNHRTAQLSNRRERPRWQGKRRVLVKIRSTACL